MSLSNDEAVIGALYTELSERSVPCFASDICDKVKGLKHKLEIVTRLLRTMCENELVVEVRGKYILKEKMPDDQGEARAGPIRIQTDAVVPVQQSLVQRSSTSVSTSNDTNVDYYTDLLGKIVDFLKNYRGAVKAKDIAQGTGIGRARSDVNRYLYFLKHQNVIEHNERKEWTLVKDVSGHDLRLYAAEMAKKPAGKSKGNPSLPESSNAECDCPNAGPRCQHFHQYNHYHNYNIQIGENNRMQDDSPSNEPQP